MIPASVGVLGFDRSRYVGRGAGDHHLTGRLVCPPLQCCDGALRERTAVAIPIVGAGREDRENLGAMPGSERAGQVHVAAGIARDEVVVTVIRPHDGVAVGVDKFHRSKNLIS